MQQGAGVASGLGQNAAMGAYGAGGQLMGAGQQLLPWGQQIMNTGFDPQQALYHRTQQQTQDQTRAGLEARGLDSSPYGAGVEGQTMANFNIDWQNQQLQRQAPAARTAPPPCRRTGTNVSTTAGEPNPSPRTIIHPAPEPPHTR